ncbi:MAG: hypothetical protein ACEQSU_03475, partial [Microgenomates group bacterium]
SAQAQDTGGVVMTFGLQERLETTSNLGLDVTNRGRTNQATTNLSFGISSETQTSRLAFDMSGVLRAAQGPGHSGTDFGFDGPKLAFSYAHSGANASLSLKAHYSDADVEYLRPLENFLDEDGHIVLPEDLADLTGTGTRRSSGLNAALTWGNDAPVGFGLSAAVSDLSYRNTTSPGLIDSRRTTLGASMRLDLSEVTKATLGLTISRFEDEAPLSSPRNTISFDAGLSQVMTTGTLTGSLSAAKTEDGTKLGFSVGRDIELPNGSLTASLGLSRAATGGTSLTGSLGLQHELPQGQITAQLRRGIGVSSDDTDSLTTVLSLGYSQTLSPLSSLSLDLSYAESTATATDNTVTNTSFGATYSHALTEDWGLNLGYRQRMRDSDGVGKADSSSVFLSLSRDFTFRP